MGMTQLQLFGERVKELRERRKMSQEELAKKTNYSRSAIAKIELGMRDIPQKKLFELSKALGVTPSYLMGWEDENGNPIETIDEKMSTFKTLLLKMDEHQIKQWLEYGEFILERGKNNNK